MKKILLFFTVATIFIACKNKENKGLAIDRNLILTDTALLHRSGIFSDTGYTVKRNSDGTITTTTVTTTTTGNPNGKVATSNNESGKNQGNNSTPSGTNKSPAGNTGTTTTPAKRDKGWSSAAKGTAIGAGSGAIIGAVVSNNKVKGAVIGGVVGGVGGYVIGRDMDKKSGRVERNKKY